MLAVKRINVINIFVIFELQISWSGVTSGVRFVCAKHCMSLNWSQVLARNFISSAKPCFQLMVTLVGNNDWIIDIAFALLPQISVQPIDDKQ